MARADYAQRELDYWPVDYGGYMIGWKSVSEWVVPGWKSGSTSCVHIAC